MTHASDWRDFNPMEIFREVISAGEEWADLKSAYEAYEDNNKSVLADLTSGFMLSSKSRAEAEMYALASEQYKAHLSAKQEARRAYLQAQVKYDSLRLLAELKRTQESTRRTEMRMQ